MKKFILFLVFIHVLIVLSVYQSKRLAMLRHAQEPVNYAGQAVQAAPMLNFILVGLSGFRGIVSEVLWYRAARLQDEGRYPELVQLSEWITRLDPQAVEAWTYTSWNLAYNISVMYSDAETRWKWVSSGIRLLRNDALAYNPGNPRLYRELAWLYADKIGDIRDSAHLYYKQALANETNTLDSAVTHAVEEKFGSLDWRQPESHAIYWAWQGLPFANADEKIQLQRAILQPLITTYFVRGNPTVFVPLLDLFAELDHETSMFRELYVRFLFTAADQTQDNKIRTLSVTRLRQIPGFEKITAEQIHTLIRRH